MTQQLAPTRSLFTARSNWRWLLVACALLLASCSSTKMGYELLDWVAMWKIDRMVKLDRDQRNTAKDVVHDAHDWHRETQLPRYAEYIEGLQQRLRAGPITAQQIHAEKDRLQLMLADSVEYIVPAATNLASSLSDAQVDDLMENIVEERQEYIDENIEPGEEKRQKADADEMKDYFKRFAGRLTQEQETWIDDWSRELLPYTELTAKQQLLWQEHLGKYLALRDDKALLQQGLREFLREYMLYHTDNWDPELRKVTDHNLTLTYDLIARLLNSQTPEQEKRLHKQLQNYMKDFLQLARKGQ